MVLTNYQDLLLLFYNAGSTFYYYLAVLSASDAIFAISDIVFDILPTSIVSYVFTAFGVVVKFLGGDDVSILYLFLGYGALFFVVVTVVKWIKDIVA